MKKAYECGICNKSYDNIEDRMACEYKCYTEHKAEEEKRKKAELEKAKEARKEEVDLAYKKYLELRGAYLKDYGSYAYSSSRDYQYDPNIWESFWRNW